MVPRVIYSQDDHHSDATEAAHIQKAPYCEEIGNCMYAPDATRPDVTHAVSALSQFLNNPGCTHR
jgi:hypothetical protein